MSDGSVRAHKCGCCEKGDKAEGTLEGGQVHYGRGEEFMLESQWWRAFMFTRPARRDGSSAGMMIDARCNWRDD